MTVKKSKKPTKKIEKKFVRPSESRRGFIRVDFEPGSKIGFEDRVYDALDLSVYGVSFLAAPADSSRFALGSELENLDFSVGDRRVKVNAKVAYLQPGLTTGLTKVAVEFVGIGIDDVWLLSSYIARVSGVEKPEDVGHIDLFPKKRRKGKAKAKAKSAKNKGTRKKTTIKAAPKKSAKKFSKKSATKKVARKKAKR